MLDENLIATLEEYLRQTRAKQNRLVARLREAENEVGLLRQEIGGLESSAAQTEQMIDSLLVSTGSGNRQSRAGHSIRIDDEYEVKQASSRLPIDTDRSADDALSSFRNNSSVAYLNQHRVIPSISANREPISQRFNDRTITQACTLLLRESGSALHVNELYNLLVAGGMKFKGNNPTISIAVSLNRNRRFRKVDPGTFDLVMREAERAVS